MIKWTKDYIKQYNHEYYIKYKTKLDKINKEWKHKNKLRMKSIQYNSWTRNRDRINSRSRETMRQNRVKLINILGGPRCTKCGYCDDWRALTLDHIRDDGNEDRKLHTNSRRLYSFYVRNPNIAISNLQVLCANCNQIKRCESMGLE